MTADVLVLGAGSAGLAAAVTAARRGARTVLVERYGFAGGMGTASLVHTFCGLYLPGGEVARLANPGFPAEMERRMREATGQEPVKMGRAWVLAQHPVEFARLADEVLCGAGVEVLFHTEMTALQAGDRWRMDGICRGTRLVVEAAAVVDATGDAVAADLLGGSAEMTEGARLQRPAYVFGISAPPAAETGLALAAHLVAGVRAGELSPAALGLHFRKSGRPGEIFGTIDLSAQEEAWNPLDPGCLSGLEREGRETAGAAVRWLAANAPDWQGAWISHWPVRAGVRESRRWRGRAVLSGAEILAGTRHADDIALAAWPLEFRETNRGPKLQYPENDRVAGIPLGCLRPAGWDRLFTAGRCISCDHGAQASIRVMGTCFATGQAAGAAAALVAAGQEPVAGLPGLEVPVLD